MNRARWLQERARGIGGSDASAIAGLNPYKTPLQVYLEKTGEWSEEVDNESIYWGNVLEDVIADEFSRQTGLRVRRRNAILQHSEHPFMIANVDRLIVGKKVGLECKTTSAYLKEDWKEDQIPDTYFLQVQHYMAVTGFKKWWIAVLIGGNTFVYKAVKRDEDIINYLITIEKNFWAQHVEKRNPPPVDGSEAANELLQKMYPHSEQDSSLELSNEQKRLFDDYLQAKQSEEMAAERRQEAENKLKAVLGNKETGFYNGKPVISWKSFSTNRIDSKKLKEEQPEVYKKYLKKTSHRRFSAKE
ncbi:hypothetical protein FCL54_01300 [Pseudalkalibacillus caeni]|uniref:YqaJ viral recombinase domain-containing protein n=2 Tax=Exobacillus caeni TaxID=2574798 RepID=A0A5R9FAZ5_9BACL|nr:hypothetical protein FCL54_01300 [Pseudalkalibacillus caeni]